MAVAVVAMVGTTAAADPTTSTAYVLPSQRPAKDDSPTLGVMAAVGAPDGASISLVVRPARALRLELGAADNYISPGVRGGITWIPFNSIVTPTFGVALGHFFNRDATDAVRTVTGDATISSPLLQQVGYDYGAARAGLEFGRKHATFFIHAGITRMTGQIHNVDQASNQASASSGSMVTVTSTDPNVTVWTVSADLGLVVYFF